MIIVGSPDIDFKELIHLFNKDTKLAEKWLKQYKWFAHDINSNFIKIYLLNEKKKKRPDIIPNYIIPNEYEILYRLTQGTGLSVAFDTTAAPFINSGQLNYCELNPVNHRNLSLIVNKQKSDQNITSELRKKLLKTEQFKRIKK